jgi:uncharacterized membrane protein
MGAVQGRVFLSVLLSVALVLSAGCRRFSGVNIDLRASESQFEPGEKKEVEIKVTRHWNEEESFRIDFEAPGDVTITPSSVDVKAGRNVAVRVTVEIKPGAPIGERLVKLRTTPDVSAYGKEWRITVGKPVTRPRSTE